MINSNRKFTIFYFLLSIYLLLNSCEQKRKTGSEYGKHEIEKKQELPQTGRVYSRSTPNGSYGLFIPNSITGNERLPAILFLDPHGDGTFPLNKYKSLAEKYKFILVGSNESKNGLNFEQVNQIVSLLLQECITNLQCDPNRITLAGFSGGAKAALYGGNAIPGFNGIIYCGAAFPPGSIEVKIPLFGIAGKKDMNYTEVRNFSSSLDARDVPHQLIEWNGKHEWPDTVTFQHTFYWAMLNDIRKKNVAVNAELFADFEKIIQESLIYNTNPLDKELILQEAIGMFNQLKSISTYQKKLALLKKSADYNKAKINQEKILQNEDKLKQLYGNSFFDKDWSWWKKEVKLLTIDKNNSSNQRILGYISLAAWTYSSRAVSENNFILAKKVLDIYKLADPENPEHEFLNARLFAKNSSPDSAVAYLKKAIDLGLANIGKIENENDLINLRSRSDYKELINSLQ